MQGRQSVLTQFENPHWKVFYISAVPHSAQNSVLPHPYKLGTHIHSFHECINVQQNEHLACLSLYCGYCGQQNKIQLTQVFTCTKSVIEVNFLHESWHEQLRQLVAKNILFLQLQMYSIDNHESRKDSRSPLTKKKKKKTDTLLPSINRCLIAYNFVSSIDSSQQTNALCVFFPFNLTRTMLKHSV